MSHNDTIVAQATPPGRGGVGILRISGLKAREVAEAVLGGEPESIRDSISGEPALRYAKQLTPVA